MSTDGAVGCGTNPGPTGRWSSSVIILVGGILQNLVVNHTVGEPIALRAEFLSPKIKAVRYPYPNNSGPNATMSNAVPITASGKRSLS